MNPCNVLKIQNPPFLIPLRPPLFRTTITISTSNHSHYSSLNPCLNPINTFFQRRKNPILKVFKCLQEDKILDSKDAALLVSTCITKNLAPALTLEQGLDMVQEAVEQLKANPPSCTSGMFRFQVAVPPSAKALNWFCCQPESGRVFPLFFLSKEDNPTYKSLALGRTHGVFGIGAAVYFNGYYSYASRNYSESQRRYPAIELDFPMAYGFLDVNFDVMSSSMKYETGSFYFFIPQIELHEFEEVTVLVSTLAWNNSSTSTFQEGVKAYEFTLYQARHHLRSFTDECSKKCITGLKTIDTMKNKIVDMLYMSAVQLGGSVLEAGILELVSPLS